MEKISKIQLNLKAEQLWEILTSPKWSVKYMYNCEIKSTFVPGAKIEWKGNYQGYEAYQIGEVMDVEPLRKLKYSTLDPNYHDPEVAENYIHVTYLIEEVDQGVIWTIINETFDGNKERMEHIVSGWEGEVIPAVVEISKSFN